MDAWRNVRLAVRSLGRSPGFASVAILTLALGIGANTAIFSFVEGVLLRPLPYPDPGALVSVWPGMVTNVRAIERLGDETRSFVDVAGGSPSDFALTGDGAAELVRGALVTPAWFDVLGKPPLLGRTFAAADQDPGSSGVVVLAHALWRERYGSDPGIVGRTIHILHTPHVVVGVMPPDFRSLDPRERLWVPQEVETGSTVGTDGTWWMMNRIARLAPGVDADRASRDLRAAALGLAEAFPEDIDRRTAEGAGVQSLQDALVGNFARTLRILLAAVGLVLLVACANVANLLLARTAARRDELAVRVAIGARRGHVLAQLLAESLVLGAIGGAAGLALAAGTLEILQAGAHVRLPRVEEVRLDGTVLLFTAATTVLASLLFGLLPAWRATRVELRDSLGRGGRGSGASAGSGRIMSALIALEVSFAVVLAIASGLLVNSLERLRGVDPGFRVDGVLTFQVSVPPRPDDAAGPDLTFQELWTRLGALPGVESVGGIQALPLTEVNNRYPYWAEGNEPAPGEGVPAANIRAATPGYLKTMGIRLLEGRWFSESDRLETPPVMVVNRALADRLWPGSTPLGKQVRLLEEDGIQWTVVGVIADVRQTALAAESRAEMYLPHEQWAFRTMFVALRTAGEPGALAPAARHAVAEVDPDVSVARMAPLEDVVSGSIASERFLTGLVGAFGLLALVLGAVGVWGVVAHAVGRRTAEYGVRMAFGASRGAILTSAMAEGMAPVGIGVLAGLAAAWAATRLLASLLYEVRPTDPLTWSVVVGVLVGVAALACYLPARRATRVDPMEALRSE